MRLYACVFKARLTCMDAALGCLKLDSLVRACTKPDPYAWVYKTCMHISEFLRVDAHNRARALMYKVGLMCVNV